MGLTFSYTWIEALTLSLLLKLSSRRLEPSMQLLCPEIALYLCKSTISPCVKDCYQELLDQLQKRICRTIGPSVAASLEPLARHRNVASLSLFYRYLGRCSSELAQVFSLSYSRGKFSDGLNDFSVTIPRCYWDINSFFLRTAKLWNSLPIECFGILCLQNAFFGPTIEMTLSLELTDTF